MLEFTLITNENGAFFAPFFPSAKKGEKMLQKDHLGVGAIVDGVSAGVCYFGVDEGAIEIVWLYVAPEYRNRGICKEMIKYVENHAKDFEASSVFAFYRSNLSSSYFLDKAFMRNDFEVNTTKSYQYELTMGELVKRPKFIKAIEIKSDSIGSKCVLLKDVPNYQLYKTGLNKWYNFKDYMNDFSIAYLEDNSVKGLLLVKTTDDKHYNLELLQTFVSSPEAVLSLIRTACLSVYDCVKNGRISKDAIFSFQNAGEKGRGFAKRVFLMEPKETVWFHSMTKECN